MKVYLVHQPNHWDKHLRRPIAAFRNEDDAVRFADLHDEAYEGYSEVEEMEVYGNLAQLLDEEYGAYFCEMFAQDDRPMPEELKPYDLEEAKE